MTDYIPRESALAAMNGDINVTGIENGESIYKYLKAVVDRLKQIPAADVVEVVWCKDCLFGHRYFEVINGKTDSWVECRNPEGLHRDVSDDEYCSASIRRREDE